MCNFLDLTADIQISIFSYLWYSDFYKTSLVNKSFHSNTRSTYLQSHLLKILLRYVYNQSASIDFDICTNSYLLAARVTNWPAFMTVEPLYQTHEVDIDGCRCVAYKGRSLGGDRVVVANDHFPVIMNKSWYREVFAEEPEMLETIMNRFLKNNGAISVSSVPFAKMWISSSNVSGLPERRIALSNIAYFEVQIKDTESIRKLMSRNFRGIPCVAIGIATPGFRLKGKVRF